MAGSGREAILGGQEWSEGPPEGSGEVEWPSRRDGSSWEALSEGRDWSGALPEGWEWSGGPIEGPRAVGISLEPLPKGR